MFHRGLIATIIAELVCVISLAGHAERRVFVLVCGIRMGFVPAHMSQFRLLAKYFATVRLEKIARAGGVASIRPGVAVTLT